jgi:hypothetical protein
MFGFWAHIRIVAWRTPTIVQARALQMISNSGMARTPGTKGDGRRFRCRSGVDISGGFAAVP